jgi:uncharacterized protein (AIM24 family)
MPARYEVISSENQQLCRVTLDQSEIFIECGALHYLHGPALELAAPQGGKETRQRCQGRGYVFLRPTPGECTVMELKNEEWIFEPGMLLAADASIALESQGPDPAPVKVSGTGKLVFAAPGVVKPHQLRGEPGEKLLVEGATVVARSANLEYTAQRAPRPSGEKVVHLFRGRGQVLLAPVMRKA